ncbi:MAG: DUF6125 family protein [Deltaproteobacteria bacterium]
MRTLERDELKELLVKCWMTHDGMWFYHCMQECGIEKASRINGAAARSVGMVEVKRIQKAFGVGEIETFERLKECFGPFFDVVKGDFMHVTYSFPSHNTIHFEMEDCFAYKGIKRIGGIDRYDCGIFERVSGWFDGLEIPHRVTPETKGCMFHTEGQCFRDFTFTLR